MRLFRWFILRPRRARAAAIGPHRARHCARRRRGRRDPADERELARGIRDRAQHRVRPHVARDSSAPAAVSTSCACRNWVGCARYGEVAPVIEGDLVFRQPGHPTEVLRLLGVDVLRDQPFRDYNLLEWGDAPDATALATTRGAGRSAHPSSSACSSIRRRRSSPPALHSRSDSAVGSTLLVTVGDRRLPLKIRGLLKDEGPARVLDGSFVLMDIAAAQQALDRFGRVDRDRGQARERDEHRHRRVRDCGATSAGAHRAAAGAARPPGRTDARRVSPQPDRPLLHRAARRAVPRLQHGSVAVLSRRGEIGALRGLGVTRGQVRTLFLAEAAALAAVGSAGGLLHRTPARECDGGADVDDGVGALHCDRVRAAGARLAYHVALAFVTGVPLSLLAALRAGARGITGAADGGDAGRRPGGRAPPASRCARSHVVVLLLLARRLARHARSDRRASSVRLCVGDRHRLRRVVPGSLHPVCRRARTRAPGPAPAQASRTGWRSPISPPPCPACRFRSPPSPSACR